MPRPFRQSSFPSTPSPHFKRYRCLWVVDGDPSYHVEQRQGFGGAGVFLTREGRGELWSAGGHGIPELPMSTLPAGSMVCIPARHPNRYACPAEGNWLFHFIAFNDSDLTTALNLPWNTIQTVTNMEDLFACGEEIAAEMLAPRPGFELRVEALFVELMVEASRGRDGRENWRRGVEMAITWIGRNLDRVPNMDRLARTSGLGRTRFFNRFRELTGRTPLQYALDRKLDSARLMLETTDKPLKEIAAALALYDEFHLSRHFKRRFGRPPAQWRKEHRPDQ